MAATQAQLIWTWDNRDPKAYEVTTKGDKRFSPLVACMPDGRTIEAWYQCDVKGFNPGGTDWKVGKGLPPAIPYLPGELYRAFLGLYRIWAVHNPELLKELYEKTKHYRVLRDVFSNPKEMHSVNQARALAQIMNEWVLPAMEPKNESL